MSVAKTEVGLIATKTKPSIVRGDDEYMTPAQWAEITPNPRQRDTEMRARRARHLRTPHPAHNMVEMGVLPNGDRYKIDGHTRAYLWENGEVEAPDLVEVLVWRCQTIADIMKLYGVRDRPEAVETLGDRMSGGYRQYQLEFESELLSTKRIGNSMRVAYELMFGHARDVSTYALLGYWIPELMLLDQCQPNRKRFPSPVVTAALITLRRHGPEVVSFWSNYARNLGNKVMGEFDAIYALDQRVRKMQAEKNISGRDKHVVLVGASIAAFEGYKRDRVYTVGLKQLSRDNVAAFVTRARDTKRTWGPRELEVIA